MEAQKFTGWVEKMFDEGQYDREIVVANYKNEATKDVMVTNFKDKKSRDWPVALKFKAGIKSGAASQLADVHEGDKVQIQFCISGKSGISKKTGSYYCINELNICKADGVVLIERASLQQSQSNQPEQEDAGDLPF